MNILTQEAKKRQAVVECAIKNDNKSYAGRKYGYSLSSVKRWCNLYDGTWQSLVEKSHRPHWTIVNKMDKKMCTKRKNKELQPD